MSEGEERRADPEQPLDEPDDGAAAADSPEDEPPLDEGLDDLDELGSTFSEEGRTDRPEGRRRRLERLVPHLLKRAIERGIEAGLNSLGNAGGRPKSEIPPPPARDPAAARDGASKDTAPKEPLHRDIAAVPKEIAGYVFSQIDDTKNVMVRVVAREVRDFLEAADLAKEFQKALTSLSFEIRTEIRFIPNEAGGVKPEVKAAISPQRARRAGRRPTAADSEEDES